MREDVLQENNKLPLSVYLQCYPPPRHQVDYLHHQHHSISKALDTPAAYPTTEDSVSNNYYMDYGTVVVIQLTIDDTPHE